MSLFNNIKIELIFFLIIILNVFISFNLDLGIYNFFLDLNKGVESVYLKDFFVDITELGNSFWYFAISIIFIIVLFANKKLSFFKIQNLDIKINFFISAIFYLIIVGALTQIIKHLVGRPRPNYTDFENSFGFNFFTFDSNYHSFPSGHSSTIFMVCFILCAILPKLKYYFFILTSIIAISRVVVGAHFITDVIAGGLLALIVFKFLNNFFQEKNKKYLFNKVDFEKNTLFFYYIIFLAGLCLLLSVGPSFDLYVANLFYHGNSQFSLQSFDLFSLLFREILIPIILIYILVLPIVGRYIKINKIFFGYRFSINEIVLIWSSQILSILIFVNLILKNFWGRARPGDILELDGREVFTPWYKISDSCDTICSFVSGDSSVGFAIIIFYFITKNKIFLYLSLLFGFLLGFIRILAGGHFLSDVVFSGIIIVLLSFLITMIYKKYYEQ